MSEIFNRNSKKTPKGTSPNPMRRATKRKREWYGEWLMARKARRDAGKAGDSNVRD